MKKFGMSLIALIAIVALHSSVAAAEDCGPMGCQAYFNAGLSAVGVYPNTNVAVPFGYPRGPGARPPVGAPPVGGPRPGVGVGVGVGVGGVNVNVGHGYPGGGYGGRPMWYGPWGRYPKVGFAAPLRRSLGLPGFTPIRQFLFGRGAIRRQSRRGGCFGRCFGRC